MGCVSCGGKTSTAGVGGSASPYAEQVKRRQEKLRAIAARTAEAEAEKQVSSQ